MNIDDILPSTERTSPATVAAGQRLSEALAELLTAAPATVTAVGLHLNEALVELLAAIYRDGARCALQSMADRFAKNPGQPLMAGQVAAALLDGAETLAKEGA